MKKIFFGIILLAISSSVFSQKKIVCGSNEIVIAGELISHLESVSGTQSFGYFDHYLLRDAIGVKFWSVFTNAQNEISSVDYFDIPYSSIDKGTGMEGTTTVSLSMDKNEYYKPSTYYYVTLLAPEGSPFNWKSYAQYDEKPTEKTNTFCSFNFLDKKLAEAAQLDITTKAGVK
jgi:hypothetical protein